ncbi:MAG: hypothetical protein IPM79_02680 [Polyangiaceae bacterium]|nr:hypothetical protein [Polyangiaceae bacterium]MBK8936570.1 hypothetical protein [Polyangiaceae bacterium]
MGSDGDLQTARFGLLDRDEVEGVLSGSFYTPARPAARAAARDAKPTHYKVICISMYTDDLKKLDEMVDELKARGLTKASRSALIRHALEGVDIEKVPRGI